MNKTVCTYNFKKGEIVTCGDIYLLKDFPIETPWFKWSEGHCSSASILRDIAFTITIKEAKFDWLVERGGEDA